MAAHRGPAARPLIEELRASPHRFELIQAMAILERHGRQAVALGAGIDPELEAFRIEQDARLGFPPSDVSAVNTDADGRPVLRTPVIGIAGITGPLPYAFTEVLLERMARRDRAMAAFLDIFNHRLASILYRIRRSTLPLLDDHPERSTVATAMRAAIGLATPFLSGRLPGVPDRMLLGFAGLLADRRRSAAGLEAMLSGAFHIRAQVRSFEGQWLTLEGDSLSRLGRKAPDEARRLGGGAVLGSRVWDQHAACAIRLRCQTLDRFVDFLPIGRHHQAVWSLARFHAGTTTDVILELELAAQAVPPLRMSARDGGRLGWTTWLHGSGTATKDGRIRLRSTGGAARGAT